MKKIFVLILLCAISMNVSAQDHLTFKGIPIDGHISTFVNKLKSLGFELEVMSDNFASVKGEFGGENCEIAIYATKTTKTTHQIIVILEKSDSWATLKHTYKEYKSLLATKYGEGDSFEHFSSPYYEGDGYEISALRNGKCGYKTTFNAANGKVAIALLYADKGVVALSYEDNTNCQIATREEDNLRAGDL